MRYLGAGRMTGRRIRTEVVDTGAPLTPSEYRVLVMRAHGMGVHEIAHVLGRSWRTVRNHQTAIYRKLGVGTQAEAFAVMGWLRAPEWR